MRSEPSTEIGAEGAQALSLEEIAKATNTPARSEMHLGEGPARVWTQVRETVAAAGTDQPVHGARRRSRRVTSPAMRSASIVPVTRQTCFRGQHQPTRLIVEVKNGDGFRRKT